MENSGELTPRELEPIEPVNPVQNEPLDSAPRATPAPFESFGTYRVRRDLGDRITEDSNGGLHRKDSKGNETILRLSKWD